MTEAEKTLLHDAITTAIKAEKKAIIFKRATIIACAVLLAILGLLGGLLWSVIL